MMSVTLKLELKNFLQDRMVLAAMCALLLAGGYAIYQGGQVIAKQQAIIDQAPALQAEHIKKQLELSPQDLSNALYYIHWDTLHRPSGWAGFAIGQRDVNPYQVKVSILTLEGQLYNSETANPNNLLYGNFDAAFVLVFLLPLLVIAWCHNLLSADQESGVWNLLRAQPVAPARVICLRLALRFAVALLPAWGLIAASCLSLKSAWDLRLAYAALITAAYLAFWFALSALVISWQKSTAFNALTLLGTWIALTILAPALLNLLISTAFPVAESFAVTVKQREGYHRKWDEPKAATMQKFYEKYPAYRSFPIPEDKFSWGWYYAMQNAGDLEAGDATAQYLAKLEKRDAWTTAVAWGLPPVNAQLCFNALTKNDLRTHLAYLESVRKHHTNLREHFYPYIFRNAQVAELDLKKLPHHDFANEAQPTTFPSLVIGLLLLCALAGAWAWRNLAHGLR